MISRILIPACTAILLSALPAAEPLKQKVNVLDLIKSGKVTYHVNDKQTIHDPPEKIWSFTEDGQLKVSGLGFGYVRTNDDYRDFHLVLEYKFTGPTHGTRTGKARDNGLFVHCHGPDGSYGGSWMAGIEAQIIEGGTGDILVLSSKLADGTEYLTSVTAEIALDRDKEKVWKRGASRQVVTKGRINWEKRDVDWKDEAGFRGRDDVESRLNEWTRYEVIAKDDTLQYFVNGVLVNECFDCKPSQGKIFLQTEGAEMLVRRYELHPLGQFKEKWNPVSASGGSDISVLKAREVSWTPAQTQKGIEIDGPYEVQLVASEPLILDPVEMTWDAKGRCFVADMIDYPLGPAPGEKPLSRIVQLLNPDKHGRYTKSKVFADHMDHVQGLLPCKDGLIATTRTQILFLRDTNGDEVADEIKPLVAGFNPRHSQLQVSAPRWGLDNCVYFNNGLDAAEIYPVAPISDLQSPISNPEKLKVTRCNLRWDPATGKLEPATGFGQFGGCFDDWGRHFFCSNRNPVMFAVMPYEAVIRNPHAGITQGWEDIGPTGAEGKVYPLQLSHTTSDAHAGTHTAACGLGVYRGDLMPELRGDIFVCEPTAQAVVRYKIEPNGASLKATRVGDHKEFFRSRDEWCRPVNATTGPDGALYICDIYRQYIDHARFFPEEFAKTHDMRLGEHEGRIWRVVPKGTRAAPQQSSSGLQSAQASATPDVGGLKSPTTLLRPIEPAPQKVEELVAWLGHKNAWQRETAQRLLAECKSSEVVQELKASSGRSTGSALAKLHQMWTYAAIWNQQKANPSDRKTESFWLQDVLADNEPRLRENLMMAEHRFGYHFTDLRELMAKGGVKAIDLKKLSPLVSSDARVRFLGIINYAFDNDLDSSSDEVAFEIAKHLDDVWAQRAVLGSFPKNSATVIFALIGSKERPFANHFTPGMAEFIKALASCAIVDGINTRVLELVKIESGKLLWWKPALLQGLAEGLPKSKKKLGVSTLAELTTKPPAQFKEAAAEIAALLTQVDIVMADAKAPLENRLAVIPLLAQRPWDKVEPVMRTLLSDGQPPELGTAALAVLRKFSTDKTAPMLYELLPKAGPAARRDMVTLLSSGKTLLDFLQRMDRGEVPKSLIGPEQRWGFQRSGNKEVKALAAKLFGTVSSDRAAVLAKYLDVAKMKGDSQKGHQVYQTICIACHKIRGEGVEVGPDITDVRIKPVDALLTDILDPNRICEARFMAYQVDTKDGRVVAGLVAAENTESVTLKLAGGVTEAVPRGNIKTMKCLDQSLMPVGVEATVNQQQMADLMAFLRGE